MTEEKREDITPQFDGCEDTHTEFKQEWSPSLLRAAAAFANTEGGIIYLGIQDSGAIIGVRNELLDALQRQCASAIRDALSFNPKVEVIDFNARKCVVIIVAPSMRLVPCKEGKNSTSNFYLRVGAKTHKMNEDDLSVWGRNRHLFIEKWEKRIEEKVASLIQLSLNGTRETQPPTATPAPEPCLTRYDDKQYKSSPKRAIQANEEQLTQEQEFAVLLKDNIITEYDVELLKKISRNRKTLSIQLVVKRRTSGYYEDEFKRALFSGNLPVYTEPQLDDGRVVARIDGQDLCDNIQDVCASIRRLHSNILLRFDGTFEGVEGLFCTFCFNGRSKDFLEYYNNISAPPAEPSV